ncbi:MAG: Hemolysins and related proteins containing CBS domains, partial [uncultured Solirubrobacteraceae bacterium]
DRAPAGRGAGARPDQRVLRRGRVRARARPPLAAGGARGGGLAARQARAHPPGRPQPVPVGLPVRHHARVAGDRLPRRAGHRRPRRAHLRRGPRVARRGDRDRLRDRHRGAHHDRRAGPEDLLDREGRADGHARRRAAARLHRRDAPVHLRAQRGLQHAAARRADRPRRGDGGGRHPRGAARPHRPGPRGRPARPGRVRDARGRLPPPRAGGAQHHDADPRRGHRGHERGRGDRAAPLHLLGPHPAARHGGQLPGPRARHRPQQLPRAGAHDGRARGVHRAARQGRADRPGDQAARRPARRAAALAHLHGGRRRRVRARGRHRHGGGHRRGGRGGDRRRDGPHGRGDPQAGQRRLVRPRPRRGDRPQRPRPRAADGHGRLQLGRRLRVRRARPAAPPGGHRPHGRLRDPRRVRPGEPDRGGAHPRAAARGRRAGRGRRRRRL